MSETSKTGTFFGVGLIMLAIGVFMSWESPIQLNNLRSRVNQPIFPEFTDPLVAASVKIVTFDDGQGTFKNFEVRRNQESGSWSITSHKGYPADAVEQMQNAANVFIQKDVQEEFNVEPSQHAEYGVVEPKEATYKVGDKGIGRMVTFKDKNQKTLASLILGNRIVDNPQQIYVRIPGQDPVYVLTLDDRPLSTNFQDWIETDLLRLSSIGIEELEIRDYSTIPDPKLKRLVTSRSYEAIIKRDVTRWKIQQVRKFDPNNEQSEGMVLEDQAGKEPSMTKLGNLLNALDDMRIVDVARKPDGVSDHLKSNKDLMSDDAVVTSIAQLGFYPQPTVDDKLELLSANGELYVRMDDGVEYALRFGNIEGLTEQQDESATDANGEKTTSLNRFLFVVADVDKSHFPLPELKPIPQTLEDIGLGDKKEGDDAEKKEGDGAEDEELSDDEKQEYLDAAQEKVRKENQRKLNERKDLMKVAERRVRNLTERFADWYYVIPESTYSMLKIKQQDLVKE